MKTRVFLLTTLLGASFTLGLLPTAQAVGPDDHDVVHDRRGQVIRSTNGNCVRTRWVSNNDECRGEPQAQLTQHQQIADEERTVYFEFDKTKLMGSERHKLSTLADTLKSMKDIRGVSIVGYADRIGTANYNERLSERRAKVVEQYLRTHGYLNTTIAKTRWLGKSEPITHCANTLDHTDLVACLQKDRRVTVEIQYRDDQ